ncbi:MAG: TlpA family protein disulfide reductase [Candidatus Saccharimonadales bacterium]
MKQLVIIFLFFISTPCSAVDLGAQAPACELKQFFDGSNIQFLKLGKVTYVDFWASWCGPCLQSMPFLEELNAQFKPKDFEVIAINLDETREDAEKFLQKYAVNFTIAINPDGQCPNAFGVLAMPSSYLIDRQGKVRHVQLGFHISDKAELRGQIEKLLAE